jgi:hypothetical protein
MQKVILVFISLFVFTISKAQHFNYHKDYERILAQTRDSGSVMYYPKLLKRFNRLDTTLNNYQMLVLMIGFTGQPNFKPYKYLSQEREIYDLNDEGKFDEALAYCDTFLAKYPLSQKALIEKSYAFHKKGMEDSSDYYSYKFTLIMRAMNWSGDGLTCETAIFSIGPADGQNFITKFKRAEIGLVMGSSRDKHSNFCDVLEMVKGKEGQEKKTTLYFGIQHASKTMIEELLKTPQK